jgi:hypothetical protein
MELSNEANLDNNEIPTDDAVNALATSAELFHNIVDENSDPSRPPEAFMVDKDFEHALEAATATYLNYSEGEGDRRLRYQSDVYEFLAACLALHKVSMKSREKRDEMLTARLVSEKHRADNEFHATVLAVVPVPDRKSLRARISQYGQCLCILDRRNVAPSDVIEEMKKDERVGNRTMSGITKMLKVYAALPEVVQRKKERRSESDLKREQVIEAGLKDAAEHSIGECSMTEGDFFEPGQTVVLIATVKRDRSVSIIGAVQDSKTVDWVLNRQFASAV